MAGALPPADPPHAYVVEYRPLDRCFTPSCRIRARDVHGYAKDVMEDGDPGAYVSQGPGLEQELFFERGRFLRPGESFVFDLPQAAHASELDVTLSATQPNDQYVADILVSALPGVGAPIPVADPVHVEGKTAHGDATLAELGKFQKYGRHVRVALPSRASRVLRITVVNRGTTKLALASPLVMKRVEGRGPRQGIIVIHDALLFHEAEAFLYGGTNEKSADWVREAVAQRGFYFPAGQTPGQGTKHFGLRFFTGAYFENAAGWPGMFGMGLDETMPAVLPGPLARAAEQGFITSFLGNDFLALPKLANVGWDYGFNSELRDNPVGMARLIEDWAKDHPHDDAMIVWWNSETHAPHGTGRTGGKPPTPDLPTTEIQNGQLTGTWRNLLVGADRLKVAYDALRAAAPDASRVIWIGEDHGSAVSRKMTRRPWRTPYGIGTGLLHAVGGTSEEANTPFAFLLDDPQHRGPRGPRVIRERINSLSAWRAFESFFDLDLDLPHSSTFTSSVFPDSRDTRVWDDRVLVSIGGTGTLRASRGPTSYVFFTPRMTQAPAWTLSRGEQSMLIGGAGTPGGFLDEQLFDDDADPYEYHDLTDKKLDDVLRMRRESADWLAAHWEDVRHPRHQSKLVFNDTVDVELFAPRPFTAVVGDVPVVSADRRLAHVHGRAVTLVEDTDPVGIIELRGAREPLVLKCSANGLPLDVLTPERPRFNLALARTNCPLPEGPHDVTGPGEVLFSFEPAAARPAARPGTPAPGNVRGAADNDELLAGMKRWGYVRDIDDKTKKP
jgi:hypothetical protein